MILSCSTITATPSAAPAAAGLEGFSITFTALIMVGYFAGLAAGPSIVLTLVARVGHIRVFAALASLISIAATLPQVIVNP